MDKYTSLANKDHFRMLAIAAAGISDADSLMQAEDSEKNLDKAFAYLSYYALVFTALCVFIPTPTANALSMMKGAALSPFVVQARTGSQSIRKENMEMRGSVVKK